jgi:hypothetical protein
MKFSGFNFKHSSVTIYDQWTKKYMAVDKKPSIYLLYRHFKGELNLVLPSYKNTNILKIDIDDRNNALPSNVAIDNIVDTLGPACIIEYSKLSRSYHMFYKLDKMYDDKFKKRLETYFKSKYKITTEVKKTNEYLKLPFSTNYRQLGVYSPFISNRVIEVVDQNIDYVGCEMARLFVNLEKTKIPQKIQHLIERDSSLKSSYSENTVANKINGNKHTVATFPWESFKYGAGTRFYKQTSMALACAYNAIGFDDFSNFCYKANDGTSKDMLRNPDYYIKDAYKYSMKIMMKKMEEDADFHCDRRNLFKQKPVSYIKQNYVLSNKNIKKLKFILNEHIYLLNVVKYKKNAERILQDSILLYQEIKGRYKFNVTNNVKYAGKFKYLNGSVALDQNTLYLMGKELGLKNIKKLVKILVATKLIELKKDKNGREYSYKSNTTFCKHFTLKRLSKVVANIYRMINKRHNTNIITLFANNTVYYVDKFLREFFPDINRLDRLLPEL